MREGPEEIAVAHINEEPRESTNMIRRLSILLALLLTASTGTYAQDVASDAGKVTKGTSHTTAKVAKKAGHGVKKGVKGVGHGVKGGATATANAVKSDINNGPPQR